MTNGNAPPRLWTPPPFKYDGTRITSLLDKPLRLRDDQLRLANPAGTFEYTMQAAALLADRILTYPLIAGTIPVLTQAATLAGVQATEGTTTSLTTVDLITITGMSIPAATPMLIIWQMRKSTGTASASQGGLKLNTTQLISNAAFCDSNADPRAAFYVLFVMPRNDNLYVAIGLAGAVGLRAGGNITAAIIANGNNAPPQVAITAVTVTGLSGNADTTTAARNLYVFLLPVNAT